MEVPRPRKRPRTKDSAGEGDVNVATLKEDTGREHSLDVDYLTGCFETNSLCGVCNKPFDEKHAPVRLTCGRGPGQHILGLSCTLDFDQLVIEEECAACAPVMLELRRTSLFSNELRKVEHKKTSTSKEARKTPVLLFPNPNVVPGTQTKFPWQTWIEDIDTHEGADYFTKLMWVETSYLSHKARDGGTVYNSDIEECVVEALMRMSRRQPYYNKTFYLKQGNWPYFLSSTRQLLRVHITSTGYCEMTDKAINDWKVEFQKVLGWKLPAVS